MPIYEYRCKKCGERIELIQKMGEVARRKCEQCGGRLEKLVSRTAFVLKGGGWYAEGYGGGSGKKKESAATDGGEAKPKTQKEPKSGSSTGDGKKNAGAG